MKTLTSRAFLAVVFIAAGAMTCQTANAVMKGEALYNGKISVPAFAPESRVLVIDAAARHGWTIMEWKPEEVTLELKRPREHMRVVAKAHFTKTEIWFEKISAEMWECPPNLMCVLDEETVQRWMIGLHRDVGAALLKAAIYDTETQLAEVVPAEAK
jgi:hypothetical protein